MGVRRFLVASFLLVAVALPVGALAIAPPATFKSTGAEQGYTVRPGVRLLAGRVGWRFRSLRFHDRSERGGLAGSPAGDSRGDALCRGWFERRSERTRKLR